jgi:Methyltransferase domain
MIQSLHCRVCGEETESVFQATVLEKYRVRYFYCGRCGFLQTETPYWLNEAYESPVATSDTGIVRRNLDVSLRLASLLFFCFARTGCYVDIAGGYGLLTRLMRDVGFNFYWSDKFSDNLLARGFEVESASPPFEAVTAIEVMEHVPDPLAFLNETMNQYKTDTVIFTTELFDGRPPSPSEWWYYSLQTGQHISFYQRKTLEHIAARLQLMLYSRDSFHMLTRKRVSSFCFSVLTGRLARAIAPVVSRLMRSLTQRDSQLILERLHSQSKAEPLNFK